MITSRKVIIFTDRQTAAARKKRYQRIEIAPIIFKYVDDELAGLFPFGPPKKIAKGLAPPTRPTASARHLERLPDNLHKPSIRWQQWFHRRMNDSCWPWLTMSRIGMRQSGTVTFVSTIRRDQRQKVPQGQEMRCNVDENKVVQGPISIPGPLDMARSPFLTRT